MAQQQTNPQKGIKIRTEKSRTVPISPGKFRQIPNKSQTISRANRQSEKVESCSKNINDLKVAQQQKSPKKVLREGPKSPEMFRYVPISSDMAQQQKNAPNGIKMMSETSPTVPIGPAKFRQIPDESQTIPRTSQQSAKVSCGGILQEYAPSFPKVPNINC